MTKTIVNLALNAVISETEEVLETYPGHPHQQAFAAPVLRQKLISYVLTRVPGVYTVVDETDEIFFNPHAVYCSPEQRIQLQQLIHEGIHQILEDDSDWVNRHIPEEPTANQMPSCWFG